MNELKLNKGDEACDSTHAFACTTVQCYVIDQCILLLNYIYIQMRGYIQFYKYMLVKLVPTLRKA